MEESKKRDTTAPTPDAVQNLRMMRAHDVGVQNVDMCVELDARGGVMWKVREKHVKRPGIGRVFPMLERNQQIRQFTPKIPLFRPVAPQIVSSHPVSP